MEMHAPPPAHIQTHTAAGYTLAKNTHRHTKILSFFHQKHTHTHTHTHIHGAGPLCIKRHRSLPENLTQRYVREEKKKNLQLCRKPFCKSLLGSPKHMRSHTHTHTHTNEWMLSARTFPRVHLHKERDGKDRKPFFDIPMGGVKCADQGPIRTRAATIN